MITIMGLDASVWCNCVETGQLDRSHPYPELLYVDEEGCPSIRSAEDEKIAAHDEWIRSSPCRHEECTLLHHRLGNISLIGGLRRTLSDLLNDVATEYSILWSHVIYSGSHCGDRLEIEEVRKLNNELKKLRTYDFTKMHAEDAYFLRGFLQQLDDLIEASLAVNKPIVF